MLSTPSPPHVQPYFDHYITETPLPISVWFAVQDMMIIDRDSPGELIMRTDDRHVSKHATTSFGDSERKN